MPYNEDLNRHEDEEILRGIPMPNEVLANKNKVIGADLEFQQLYNLEWPEEVNENLGFEYIYIKHLNFPSYITINGAIFQAFNEVIFPFQKNYQLYKLINEEERPKLFRGIDRGDIQLIDIIPVAFKLFKDNIINDNSGLLINGTKYCKALYEKNQKTPAGELIKFTFNGGMDATLSITIEDGNPILIDDEGNRIVIKRQEEEEFHMPYNDAHNIVGREMFVQKPNNNRNENMPQNEIREVNEDVNAYDRQFNLVNFDKFFIQKDKADRSIFYINKRVFKKLKDEEQREFWNQQPQLEDYFVYAQVDNKINNNLIEGTIPKDIRVKMQCIINPNDPIVINNTNYKADREGGAFGLTVKYNPDNLLVEDIENPRQRKDNPIKRAQQIVEQNIWRRIEDEHVHANIGIDFAEPEPAPEPEVGQGVEMPEPDGEWIEPIELPLEAFELEVNERKKQPVIKLSSSNNSYISIYNELGIWVIRIYENGKVLFNNTQKPVDVQSRDFWKHVSFQGQRIYSKIKMLEMENIELKTKIEFMEAMERINKTHDKITKDALSQPSMLEKYEKDVAGLPYIIKKGGEVEYIDKGKEMPDSNE